MNDHLIKPGDQIGIIAPSGPFKKIRLEPAIKYFENAGYKVKLGSHIYKTDRYLAGSIKERLQDIHEMFRTKSVKAIFTARGGYGCSQLLPYIKYSMIAENPKPLFGLSDSTALQIALWEKAKLPSISGLSLCYDFTKTGPPAFTRKYFEFFLETSAFDSILLKSKKSQTTIQGTLIGGCLSLVAALCGTDFQPKLKNRILFLEDVKEEPYNIDRMLTQLSQQKDFHQLKAIIFGNFFQCVSENVKYGTTDEVLKKFEHSISVPVFYNLPYGHQLNRRQIPIGLKVTIDENSVLNFSPFKIL